MSLYEWLTRQSWRGGKFDINSQTSAPSAENRWEKPEILRDRLKQDMERIVNEEAEDLTSDKENGMKLAKFVKFREEKFGGVLFETRSEKVYTLNPTGAAVVREINAGGEGDVIERLKSKFQDPTGGMEKDARAFLEDLKAKNLVVE